MLTYPIKLSYHVRSYYFGERLIPKMLGKRDAPEGIVAETWEISDYRESTGQITNGEYAGRTLHDLVQEFPDELVGRDWRGPHFPILLKFLDASHMPPVHLHADDETARRKHGEPHGKTEAWHILWAEPGATILAGIKDEPTREELFAAFKAQDYDSVGDATARSPAWRHRLRAGRGPPHLRSGHPDRRGPADLGPRPVRDAHRPIQHPPERRGVGRQHRGNPRRAPNGLPAAPEFRSRPARRRPQPPRPLLRRTALRPREVDAF
jgi:hypothetical protein